MVGGCPVIWASKLQTNITGVSIEEGLIISSEAFPDGD